MRRQASRTCYHSNRSDLDDRNKRVIPSPVLRAAGPLYLVYMALLYPKTWPNKLPYVQSLLIRITRCTARELSVSSVYQSFVTVLSAAPLWRHVWRRPSDSWQHQRRTVGLHNWAVSLAAAMCLDGSSYLSLSHHPETVLHRRSYEVRGIS